MQGTLNPNLRLPVHTARASASGISTRHNPEFTSVEIYQAYADFSDMMTLTEEIVAGAAQEVRGSTTLEYQGTDIDLTPPWRRETMLDLVTAEMPDGVTFPAPGGSGGAAQLEEARAFEGFVWHRVGEQHHQPVDTNPEPTRRRHTMLKCQQEIFVDALEVRRGGGTT